MQLDERTGEDNNRDGVNNLSDDSSFEELNDPSGDCKRQPEKTKKKPQLSKGNSSSSSKSRGGIEGMKSFVPSIFKPTPLTIRGLGNMFEEPAPSELKFNSWGR